MEYPFDIPTHSVYLVTVASMGLGPVSTPALPLVSALGGETKTLL